MKIYSWLIFLVCLAGFSGELQAKKYKAPKWKNGVFTAAPSGISACIVKAGKGNKAKPGDNVRFFYTRYDRVTKQPIADTILDRKRGMLIKLENELNNLEKALQMLARNGSGYFILPTGSLGADGKPDSAYFFMKIKEIIPGASSTVLTGEQPKADSVGFVIKDPATDNYGDTLFTTMKLVEVQKIVPCGMMRVMNVMKFQMTWFDNGVQRKDIYLYIECPENYGKDYFTPGSTFVVTAIPLLENHKKNRQVFNPYANLKDPVESYFCLRITKK